MIRPDKPLRRVVVFCGSAFGNDPVFRAEAAALGEAIAAAGLGLVYGGACSGLMGTVADAALAGGAEVTGVLPEVLKGREIAHYGLTTLEFAATMHERKARMHELADAIASRCPVALALSMNCSKQSPGRRSVSMPNLAFWLTRRAIGTGCSRSSIPRSRPVLSRRKNRKPCCVWLPTLRKRSKWR